MNRPWMLGVLLVATSIVAKAPVSVGKASWEWNDSDRIAARMDATAASARVRRAGKERADGRLAANSTSSAKPVDVIDGKHDPHLFLPWELFDQLMRGGYADDPPTRAAYRATKEKERQRLGLPADMWDRLESMTAAYRGDRVREREVALSRLPVEQRRSESQRISMLLCRDRYAALTEAQAQFGPAFKRFLYTAVAPSMKSFAVTSPDPEKLASVSRGCP